MMPQTGMYVVMLPDKSRRLEDHAHMSLQQLMARYILTPLFL